MENIKLRKLKAKDKKKIIKLVKAINSAEGFSLTDFINRTSKIFNLELSEEEIKIYTSNIPEESKKDYDGFSEERKIAILKEMKREKESMNNMYEMIIELIDVYDGVADIIDEIISSVAGLEIEEIEELDLDVYFKVIKDLIFSKQFKKLFPTA